MSGIPFAGTHDQERWGTAVALVDVVAMRGTAINCWWFSSNNGEGTTGHMYLQTNGSNIAQYIGSLGSFNRAADVPIG